MPDVPPPSCPPSRPISAARRRPRLAPCLLHPQAVRRGGGYRVELDAYAGPLDLLLHLVKRHEIDLQDIPMARLTSQYLEHLRAMQDQPGVMDVERAGEFLVMAATLVEIKSALLMPRLGEDPDAEGEGEDPTQDASVDPRFELVQQLLAYKRYKDASLALDSRRAEWDERYPAAAQLGKPNRGGATNSDATDESDDSDVPPVEIDLDDVNVLDLCAAFGRMLDSIGFTGDHEVTYDDTPISLHAEDIADRLERDGRRGGPDPAGPVRRPPLAQRDDRAVPGDARAGPPAPRPRAPARGGRGHPPAAAAPVGP